MSLALQIALLAGGGCRRGPKRSSERTAAAVAQHVATPRWREVRVRAAGLVTATGALEATPSAATLTVARGALRDALVAIEAARPLRLGVPDEENLLLGAAYWPIRAASIEAVIAGEAPLDATAIALAGAHQRGLYALEYLLFSPRSGAPNAADRGVAAAGADEDAVVVGLVASPRRRRYVVLVAEVAAEALRRLASRIEAESAPGRSTETRAALGALLNDLIDALEAQVMRSGEDASNRLGRTGARPVARLPGEASGAAALATRTVLGVARAVLDGPPEGGLRALLESIAPDAAGRLVAALARAEAAVSAPMKRPEAALERTQALRALEVLLKTEVLAALGVTRTFRSIDGD